MIKRLIGAVVRALMVVGLVMAPALILSSAPQDASQIVAFAGLLAGLWVFFEYSSDAPVVVGFRYAGPFNRLRFGGAVLSVLTLSWVVLHPSSGLGAVAAVLGKSAAVPGAPGFLLLKLAPVGTDTALARAAIGLATACSVLMVLGFVLALKLFDWPLSAGAFNVHRNLPMFDPTSGTDVVLRLRRVANVNLMLGAIMPFVVPVLAWFMSSLLSFLSSASPHVLVWGVSLWALVPGWLVMRGLAVHRVATLIEDKRRRAYAQRGLQAWQLV